MQRLPGGSRGQASSLQEYTRTGTRLTVRQPAFGRGRVSFPILNGVTGSMSKDAVRVKVHEKTAVIGILVFGNILRSCLTKFDACRI